jgi:molybdenum cofactor cytidylyltransferase
VAAIVLAAGRSARYPGVPSKLVASLEGKPVVRRVVEAVVGSRASPTVVVTGHACEHVREALAGTRVTFLHNDHYETGVASSIRVGLRALPADADGAVIVLADMPKITSSLIDSLVETFSARRADAIAPVFEGRAGNPVLVSRRLFGRIARLSGDRGARRILSEPGVDTVQLAVSDSAVVCDVDLPEDLQRLAEFEVFS